MTVSVGAQAAEFLYALLMGIGTGVLYVTAHYIKKLRFFKVIYTRLLNAKCHEWFVQYSK